MTDWNALAQARGLDIPPEAIASFAPTLDALEEAFRPLLKELGGGYDSALILSEAAVLGE
jgi:hypothetical protein